MKAAMVMWWTFCSTVPRVEMPTVLSSVCLQSGRISRYAKKLVMCLRLISLERFGARALRRSELTLRANTACI